MYHPLKVCQQIYERDGKDPTSVLFKIKNPDGSVIPDDEFCDFLFGDSFLTHAYNGRFKRVNDIAFDPPVMFQLPIIDSHADIRTELRDIFGIPAVVRLWAKHKLVYKIDADFFDELANSEDPQIPQGTFTFLPAKTLYIDLSDCKGIEPMIGAFVYSLGDQIAVFMVSEDSFFSFYSAFDYEKSNFAYYSRNDIPETKFMSVSLESDNNMKIQHYKKDVRPAVVAAIINVLLFLSCENTDIMENPVTKKTYRRSDFVKNKFSEIQMWDVGVRYGAAIRAYKGGSRSASSVPHRSPRPHIRRAHWQRFRVGKGRKETRLRWLMPITVNGKGELPVVIRKVEGNV